MSELEKLIAERAEEEAEDELQRLFFRFASDLYHLSGVKLADIKLTVIGSHSATDCVLELIKRGFEKPTKERAVKRAMQSFVDIVSRMERNEKSIISAARAVKKEGD